MYYKNVLETIGNTPLIKLNKVADGIPALVLAKVDTFNPGNSIKDRMAVKMIDDAEARGDLKPGGTIIECTSGNTGMGLALVAAVRGYKCIFTTSDKQSKEKIDLLKAFGAEVIVCPTNVAADDPKSYYSVAAKLERELPDAYWCNQYDNLSNRAAHYESTGPEIWEQTDGKVTHLIVGVGTGGTISGTGKYLKEKNPNIQIWGIDTYGSALKKYHETGEIVASEIYPYITEGIGEDIIPANVDFEVIDHFEKVNDKDGALAARALARDEGLMLGYSAGSALAGLHQLKDRLKADDVVVLIFHDHGSRYVGKIFNDEWMKERGFIEYELKLQDVIDKKGSTNFITIGQSDHIKEALELMKSHDFSQLPVIDENGTIVGSISETQLVNYLLTEQEDTAERTVIDLMSEPLPTLPSEYSCKVLTKYFDQQTKAVVVEDRTGNKHLITQYDLIHAL